MEVDLKKTFGNKKDLESGASYVVCSSCRLCKKNDLELVVDLPCTVPGEHLKETLGSSTPDPIPIDLYQCKSCGHVQIIHVPKKELLFGNDYSYMTTFNPIFENHFERTVRYFLNDQRLQLNFAFEIGSNDGLFLSKLKQRANCKVLGVDPSIRPVEKARDSNIPTILDYFNSDLAKQIVNEHGRPDLVIANNVFAHMDDLQGVLQSIVDMLDDGGYFLFETSYLGDVVDRFLIGTIIHEHISIHSVYSLVPFLAKEGLQLIDYRHEKDIQGGVIVGIARKTSSQELPLKIQRLIQREHELGITAIEGMRGFNLRLKQKVNKHKKKIHEILSHKKLIGYGAARSAALIIDLFELSDHIDYIIDDDPMKINKYMPVGNIPIVSIQEHSKSFDGAVIVLGWHQTKRIINRLSKTNPKAIIITVYPDFEILSTQLSNI